MTGELIVALGSFVAMIVTWALLPGESRRRVEEKAVPLGKEERTATA